MDFLYSDKAKNMRPSIIREILKQTSNPNIISFAGGSPAEEAFPVQEIREISEYLMKNQPYSVLQYSLTEGLPELRSAAAEYLNSECEIKHGFDDILVTSGSQQIMEFVAKIMCNEGDTVVSENPAFLGALNSFRSFGAKIVGVPLASDGVDLGKLEKAFAQNPKPKFYYTIPNFQNPTGITTSLQKRKEVYRLAAKYGVLILEDNPYGALSFTGETLPPIKSFDTEGIVVYAASFSKILSPGLRIAFCAAHKDIVRKMTVAKQGSDVHTCLWSQQVCLRYLKNYDIKAHISRIQKIYKEKAECMTGAISQKLGSKLSYIRPQGGMFVWLTLQSGIDVPKFVVECLEKKLAVVPGAAFFVDETSTSQTVRLNFSSSSCERIVQGIDIMASVLK